MEVSETGNELKPIIVYDGQCSFCKICIRWVKRYAPENRFRYINYYSSDPSFQNWLLSNGITDFNSVIYIERQSFFIKSDAVLEILRKLSFPWKGLSILRFIPPGIRDYIYDRIALNRSCTVFSERKI
ncbi:MAG: DUF393 domain-containing protein [Bacteroidia bacterium]|nr:DUF393 domain-containing protein [Bacteroidia bacterium]MCZ2276645.1 DUF393 domain-containing protein [Bacteroidia bacterium]